MWSLDSTHSLDNFLLLRPQICSNPLPKTKGSSNVCCHFLRTRHCIWSALMLGLHLALLLPGMVGIWAHTCMLPLGETQNSRFAVSKLALISPAPSSSRDRDRTAMQLDLCDVWHFWVWDLCADRQLWCNLWTQLSAAVSREHVCAQKALTH